MHHTGSTTKSGPFSKPRRQFLITLFTTIYVMCGKVNFTNLSRYSELSERTYRRHFEQPYEFMSLNQVVIENAIVPTHFQVGVVDASFIPKSGKATYGVDWFYNGKASRTERGLEISMFAVVDVEQVIGYTLSVQQTPALEPVDEPDTDRTRVDDYLDHLRATRDAFPTAVRYLGFVVKVRHPSSARVSIYCDVLKCTGK